MTTPQKARLLEERDVRTVCHGIDAVLLGTVGKWAMVRNASYPRALPLVMSVRDWEKAPRALAQQEPETLSDNQEMK